MTVLLDSPEIFGHTIFCDDIRFEVDGKFTYVGVYQGTMYVHAVFPVTLPKFAIAISFYQKKEIFTPSLGLRVFMPGDTEDKASIEGEIKGGSSDAEIRATIESSDSEKPFVQLGTTAIFTSFVINKPGLIKVRILRNSEMHRLGILRVVSAPVQVQQPPIE